MKSNLSLFELPNENQVKTIDEFDIKISKEMKAMVTKGSNELKRCLDLIFLEQNISNIKDFQQAVKYLLKPILSTSFGLNFTNGYLNTGYSKTHYIKIGKDNVVNSSMMEHGKEEDLIDFVYFLHGFTRSYFEILGFNVLITNNHILGNFEKFIKIYIKYEEEGLYIDGK